MGFHHVAIVTRDLEASHRFYTEAMGFELSEVEVMPFGDQGGWARHVFYDTGDGPMLALWDLHDEGQLGDYPTGISTGLGLPNFVNHIAFTATDLDDVTARKDRLVANGHDVVRIDHGWCVSIYADDPSGNMMEFCTTTRVLDENDRKLAQERLFAAQPEINKTEPPIEFFEGSRDHAGVS